MSPDKKVPPEEEIPPPTIGEILKAKRHKVIAFCSDLHIGADKDVDDFDADDEKEFKKMLDWLDAVGRNSHSKLEFVLLGDILEIWETEDFFDDEDSHKEKIEKTKQKLNKIVNAHKSVFNKLATFSKRNRVIYVLGNHDDDLRDVSLQKHLNDISNVEFEFRPTGYINVDFEVKAEHGHRFDDSNNSSKFGEKPLGRKIVEEFSTGLEKVTDLIDVPNSIRQIITKPFKYIDAFDKVSDFPLYLRCLMSKGLISRKAYDKAEELFDRLDKLELPGIHADLAKILINGLRQEGPFDTIKFWAKFKDSWIAEHIFRVRLGPKYPKDYESASENGIYSCVLMGHTHVPFIKNIARNKMYVNTGTWMDKVRLNQLNVPPGIKRKNNIPPEDHCIDKQSTRYVTLLARTDFKPSDRYFPVAVNQYTFPGPRRAEPETYYYLRYPRQF